MPKAGRNPNVPRCYGCDKKITRTIPRYKPGFGVEGSGTFKREENYPARWRGYPRGCTGIPLFCSLKCALHFAVIHVRAGQRLALDGKLRDGGKRDG